MTHEDKSYLMHKEAFIQMRKHMEKIAQEYATPPEAEIGGLIGLGAGTLGASSYITNTRLKRELNEAVQDQKRLGLMGDVEENAYRKAYRMPIIRESLNPKKAIPQAVKENLPMLLGGAILGSGAGQLSGHLLAMKRQKEKEYN